MKKLHCSGIFIYLWTSEHYQPNWGFLLCLSSSCVLCFQCCQCLWIVHFLLPGRFSAYSFTI